ncbi:MAG TPA: GxxExxY protein [Phycisphaerae bacterium]|nr:GxxExxY protein [Phycisphaerae bacterium]
MDSTASAPGDRVYHRKLSFQVVGCAQKVHRTLGPGFPESVYQTALCHELATSQIPFDGEKTVEVFYDRVLCGRFRMDVVVDQKIVLELKALDKLTDDHVAQALSYLKATDLRLAILINFGTRSLETKRVVL